MGCGLWAGSRVRSTEEMAETFKMCSFWGVFCSVLHLMTGSHGHRVTSKTERNPIRREYRTRRAADDSRPGDWAVFVHVILKHIATIQLVESDLIHLSLLLKNFPTSVTIFSFLEINQTSHGFTFTNISIQYVHKSCTAVRLGLWMTSGVHYITRAYCQSVSWQMKGTGVGP